MSQPTNGAAGGGSGAPLAGERGKESPRQTIETAKPKRGSGGASTERSTSVERGGGTETQAGTQTMEKERRKKERRRDKALKEKRRTEERPSNWNEVNNEDRAFWHEIDRQLDELRIDQAMRSAAYRPAPKSYSCRARCTAPKRGRMETVAKRGAAEVADYMTDLEREATKGYISLSWARHQRTRTRPKSKTEGGGDAAASGASAIAAAPADGPGNAVWRSEVSKGDEAASHQSKEPTVNTAGYTSTFEVTVDRTQKPPT